MHTPTTATKVEPERFTFAVYPADYAADSGGSFDSFLLEVPTLSGEDFAARRAWWSAFHLLGPQGVEPEDFLVACWRNDAPGPAVGSGGIIQ